LLLYFLYTKKKNIVLISESVYQCGVVSSKISRKCAQTAGAAGGTPRANGAQDAGHQGSF